MSICRLFYVDGIFQIEETFHGYPEVQGVEQAYTGISVRDRIVARFDMIYSLQDFFGIETIEKYRSLIYSLISGKVDRAGDISDVVRSLYLTDMKFKRYLGTAVYFGDKSKSLYDRIITDINGRITSVRLDIEKNLRRRRQKYLVESMAYVYISIPDSDVPLIVPNGCREEILSIAKVRADRIIRSK